MKKTIKHRYKIIIAILAFSMLAGYCIGSAIALLNIPDEIRLTEFATHKLNIGLPLSASFNGETAPVAKINNQPVTYGFSIRTHQPLTIITDGAGTAEMTLGVFGLPMRRITLDVAPDIKVIPLGTAIGVRINTDGVMVLGTGGFLGEDGESHRPSDDILRAGDLIFKVNGNPVQSKESLSNLVAESEGNITLHLRRDDKEITVTLAPAVAAVDGIRRIGAWVRDSTKGIGTLTYYNPRTGSFGALGHGIMDVDTKKLMSVKNGVIMPSTVTSVVRGARGAPGELEGMVNTNRTLGQITTNSNNGVFGALDEDAKDKIILQNPMPIALRSHIKEGPATVLTNVTGDDVREYEIYIEGVNRFTSDDTKGMVIRITDPELLKITGGIVQGMSGSPILQNGRLVGAITHVFVQDPTKGYGIFIESMMDIHATRYSALDVEPCQSYAIIASQTFR